MLAQGVALTHGAAVYLGWPGCIKGRQAARQVREGGASTDSSSGGSNVADALALPICPHDTASKTSLQIPSIAVEVLSRVEVLRRVQVPRTATDGDAAREPRARARAISGLVGGANRGGDRSWQASRSLAGAARSKRSRSERAEANRRRLLGQGRTRSRGPQLPPPDESEQEPRRRHAGDDG